MISYGYTYGDGDAAISIFLFFSETWGMFLRHENCGIDESGSFGGTKVNYEQAEHSRGK